MSFSSAFGTGARVAQSWVNDYKKNKEEEITNQLFKAKQDMSQERQIRNAEGEMMTQQAVDFSKMSGDQISTAILNEVRAGGGKIDDQTYTIAYKMGTLFQGVKDKTMEHEAKLSLLDARERNLNNMIFNRNKSNEKGRLLESYDGSGAMTRDGHMYPATENESLMDDFRRDMDIVGDRLGYKKNPKTGRFSKEQTNIIKNKLFKDKPQYQEHFGYNVKTKTDKKDDLDIDIPTETKNGKTRNGGKEMYYNGEWVPVPKKYRK